MSKTHRKPCELCEGSGEARAVKRKTDLNSATQWIVEHVECPLCEGRGEADDA